MKKILIIIIAVWNTQALFSQQCLEERHSTNITDSWVSCQISSNPYISTGNSHWILYNFNAVENLYESTIWNINHPDYLDYGIKRLRFDYSLDKTNWTFWGTINFPQAQARSDYLGEPGPDFNGIAAKHLLITVLENYGDLSCSGFSEIKINTESADCPNEIVFETNDNIISTENHQAKNIIAYNSIHNNADVTLIGENSVQLLQGFELELGSKLHAYITICD